MFNKLNKATLNILGSFSLCAESMKNLVQGIFGTISSVLDRRIMQFFVPKLVSNTFVSLWGFKPSSKPSGGAEKTSYRHSPSGFGELTTLCLLGLLFWESWQSTMDGIWFWIDNWVHEMADSDLFLTANGQIFVALATGVVLSYMILLGADCFLSCRHVRRRNETGIHGRMEYYVRKCFSQSFLHLRYEWRGKNVRKYVTSVALHS